LFVTIAAVMREHDRQRDASVEASGPRDFAVRDRQRSSAATFASTASLPNVS